jgi:hypothetical protein
MVMTQDEAKQRIEALNRSIATAVLLIQGEAETLDQFFAEATTMASVGPILDPTLFNSSERQAAEALLTPVYEAARNLIRTYDAQVEKVSAALERVR